MMQVYSLNEKQEALSSRKKLSAKFNRLLSKTTWKHFDTQQKAWMYEK